MLSARRHKVLRIRIIVFFFFFLWTAQFIKSVRYLVVPQTDTYDVFRWRPRNGPIIYWKPSDIPGGGSVVDQQSSPIKGLATITKVSVPRESLHKTITENPILGGGGRSLKNPGRAADTDAVNDKKK